MRGQLWQNVKFCIIMHYSLLLWLKPESLWLKCRSALEKPLADTAFVQRPFRQAPSFSLWEGCVEAQVWRTKYQSEGEH